MTPFDRGKRAKADADRRAQVELIASQKKRELATTLHIFLPPK